MPFESPECFVSNLLPAILAGKSSLSAIFCSYNPITDLVNGEQKLAADKPGLRVVVQAGDAYTSPAMMLSWTMLAGASLAGDERRAWQSARRMDAIASAAQSDVEGALAEANAFEGADLLFLYAGLTAFDTALQFGRRLREERPGLKVVVLTCDCDLERKRYVLEPLLGIGDLCAVIETYECGGRRTMGELVTALIDAWSPPVMADKG